MANSEHTGVTTDPWLRLRAYTSARVALGRAGVSLPTREHLALQLAHARAREAVGSGVDLDALEGSLTERGLTVVRVRSAAPDRTTFLQRPDRGRRLHDADRPVLERIAQVGERYDLVLVIADGLSAHAVQRHAVGVLDALVPLLADDWRLAPIVLVEQGRVAISDEIGALVGAEQVALLIGERPGLSTPDSLGIYLTYGPRPGNTDADRNCISNIHTAGLSYAAAARKLAYLLREARRRGVSGVALKDDSDSLQGGGAHPWNLEP
jgi:ethanolamine ammonia-lyase small subunit